MVTTWEQLGANYCRAGEQVLLADYLKVVPALTINDTNVLNPNQQQQALEKRHEENELETKAMKQQPEEIQKSNEAVQRFVNVEFPTTMRNFLSGRAAKGIIRSGSIVNFFAEDEKQNDPQIKKLVEAFWDRAPQYVNELHPIGEGR